MIPIKYNYRSILVRRMGTAMTAIGIGITVAIVVVMLAMIHGLDMTFVESGDNLHLVVIREGSLNEVNSYFERPAYDAIRFLEGIRRDAENEPMVVGELTLALNLFRKSGSESNVIIRGTAPMGIALRPGFKLLEGKMFQDGLREVLVTKSISERFQGMALGDTLIVYDQPFKIVGLFEVPDGVYDSEIWGGYNDLAQVSTRPIFSSLLLLAETEDAAQKLIDRIEDDERIQLNAFTQKAYFAEQTTSSIGLKALAVFVAVVMGIGSCFAIMNMMYGSVMARQQEVATLRALGFRRGSILMSFLLESGLMGLIGGVAGCSIGLLFNGYSAGTSNLSSFSEVVFNFKVTPEIILQGLTFSLVMGLIGGFLPARRASSVKLIDVLRQ